MKHDTVSLFSIIIRDIPREGVDSTLDIYIYTITTEVRGAVQSQQME